MDRDSRRNLLALNYAVIYLVQNKLFSKGARVINIAGISCNPATGLTGNPHWKCLALFMQKWYNWASRESFSYFLFNLLNELDICTCVALHC